MHYIRFLKPPRVVISDTRKGHLVVKAKVTVTTDLGESFLWANVNLVVELLDETGEHVITKGKEYTWRGSEGMRSLEIEVSARGLLHKKPVDVLRMLVRPKDGESSVHRFDLALSMEDKVDRIEQQGGIVAVRSLAMSNGITKLPIQQGGAPLAERVFETGKSKINIWEETGESIARHIWDAGLLLSAYLSSISPLNTGSSLSTNHLPLLPTLQKSLSNPDLKVIELGAGCGIVGITLATLFPQLSQLILTDLPEATEILTKNLSLLPALSKAKTTHQVLDWSAPLPPNIAATKWDLAVVADCTYNPDVVPDLVKTLKEIGPGIVLLAMKVRHESEMVFFELMTEGGFAVLEKCVLTLPVLNGEGQEIEVFVFGVL